jgi:transcription initiation factor TFIIIB Brf1 subunit/transcription initiation factor TFIIB
MKSETLKSYSNTKFRRITGVKRATFEKMTEILIAALGKKLSKGGRKPTLSVEEMLLAALEYWREYRTYAHIAVSYGIDESNIYRTIKWTEEILIKDGTFSLPGKNALLKKEAAYTMILIDATESPVERPKKNKDFGIPASKNAIQ